MSKIEFTEVRKSFGDERAVAGLSLSISDGELVSILGPSGCGKTTALRMLAGFINPDAGEIYVDGKAITSTPAQHRNFGMVFQAYSLFPNMTAAENIAFALEVRKVGKTETQKRVKELIELIGIPQHKSKYPHQLSGGQQQRVALARALAAAPRVLLLDEPLSALDAAVREQLRTEIKQVQQQSGVTTIFVTHDQQEALSISDRVAVMRSGQLEQIDTPEKVYRDPATEFVANFVGHTNKIDLADERLSQDSHSFDLSSLEIAATAEFVFLRPEEIRISPSPDSKFEVRAKSFLGSITRYRVGFADLEFQVDVAETRENSNIEVGDRASLASTRKHPLALSKN